MGSMSAEFDEGIAARLGYRKFGADSSVAFDN
jgi:hypothetical protein